MNIPPSTHLSISSTRLGGSSATSAADGLIEPNAAEIQALPPVDRGRDAWLFLAAAFTIETLVSGLPSSVGILHQYWSTVLFQHADESLLTMAATLQTGLMYCSSLVYGYLLQRYPQHRANMQLAGLVTATVGILTSAFVTQPWQLIVTVGVLYPLGGTICYLPAATLLFEWFQTRRGLASGVMYAGTGLGGTLFPFVMRSLLDKFGYRAGIISLAVGFGILGATSLMFIKPRIPVARSRRDDLIPNRRRMDTSFIRHSPFYAFAGAILLTSLGNFIPLIYLPAYAVDLGLKTSDGTALVAIMNAASVPGILLLGHLSDKLPLRLVILLSCFGSAVTCLILWGFATSIGVLVLFSIAFGFLGLSFSGVWAALITVIAKDDPHLPTTLFALFSFARGIGNIVSGPISSALLEHAPLHGARFGFGVENYGSLLLYTGAMMVAGSGVGIIYREAS